MPKLLYAFLVLSTSFSGGCNFSDSYKRMKTAHIVEIWSLLLYKKRSNLTGGKKKEFYLMEIIFLTVIKIVNYS